MYCWKCGAHNDSTSRFCIKCGTDLAKGQLTKQRPVEELPLEQSSPIEPPSQEYYNDSPAIRPAAIQTPIDVSAEVVTEAIQSPKGLIGNRYRIEGELGRGGRGVVFKAYDVELEIYIAIKFLPPELAADQAAVEELKTEAKAAMMLSHPNIVRLHNFEDLSGYKFITMELINGPTLDEMLQRRKQFTLTEAIQYSAQVLDGLDFAHKKGVIHRDIKPSNLMKTPDGVIKITDYGIASIINESIKKVSSEFVIGTPRYMSPEQLLGKPLDNRTDIYSYGIVLYEFLNGSPPFKSGGLEYQIINSDPPPLQNVPEKVNYIIGKALAKKREDRWETAKQFSDALEDKIKIVLPTEGPVKETVAEKFKSSVQDISSGLKSAIKESKQQARRTKLERRKEVFDKKKRLPVFIESSIFRYSIISLWLLSSMLFFPFKINVSGLNESLYLLSLFMQAVIFGLLTYSRWIGALAAGALPLTGYLISFSESHSFVMEQGFAALIVLAIMNAFVAAFVAHMKLYKNYDIKKFWQGRDAFVFWFVVIGGLFLIPILEDFTKLGLTHAAVFGYVLVISLFVIKGYNSFLFPFITLTLFSFSRLGFDNFMGIFVGDTRVLTIGNEIISIPSFKTLIWELTLLTGVLSLVLVLCGFIFRYFSTVVNFVGKTIVGIILIGLCLYAYLIWISKDVYINTKVLVPAGEIRIGLSEEEAINLSNLYNWDLDKFAPELPGLVKSNEAFYIDRYEVTNRQYKEFVDVTGHPAPEHWPGGEFPFSNDFDPVVGISLEDAKAYAKFRGGRLPTESEWMLAAGGNYRILFPWGNDLETSFPISTVLSSPANNQEANYIQSATVGWFFTDLSPFGCFDMGGNVMEWVDDPYEPFPGNTKINLEPDFDKKYHLVKGGSYNHPIINSRISSRFGIPADAKKLDVGFRCVYDIDKKRGNGAKHDG
ncbi:MAG: SUMF1/EgtB/PvdO family nonheme iron enzyme [Acidobacteria bacterium]|nr:SUMF1/EgtB/PvdO family nonheme iron enzyme [Acidobacteriota bacterium]